MTGGDLTAVTFDPCAGHPVIVLERIEPGRAPDHCVHGRATCVGCDNWVWLGDATSQVVGSGQALPMCRECAERMIPHDQASFRHVDDHRRADGPHE